MGRLSKVRVGIRVSVRISYFSFSDRMGTGLPDVVICRVPDL